MAQIPVIVLRVYVPCFALTQRSVFFGWMLMFIPFIVLNATQSVICTPGTTMDTAFVVNKNAGKFKDM